MKEQLDALKSDGMKESDLYEDINDMCEEYRSEYYIRMDNMAKSKNKLGGLLENTKLAMDILRASGLVPEKEITSAQSRYLG